MAEQAPEHQEEQEKDPHLLGLFFFL